MPLSSLDIKIPYVHVYWTSLVSLIMLAAPEYSLLKQYGTAGLGAGPCCCSCMTSEVLL